MRWFDAEVLQRLNNKRTGAVIVIMQRLHHDDLTAHLLAQATPWVHLNMPRSARAGALSTEPRQRDVQRIHDPSR